MSALLMGRVFYTELPSHLRFTLLALADHANDDGTGIFVGQERLARKVGCSVRSVHANLCALREQGYLEQEARVGRNGTHRYRLEVDRLPSLEDCRAPIDRKPTADRKELPTGSPLPIDTPSTGSTACVDRKPTSTKPSGEPSGVRQPSVLRSEFDVFWFGYPPRNGRRNGKLEAWREWQRLRPAPELQSLMRAAVLRYASSTDLPVDCVRWLKRRRWEDEEAAPERPMAKVREMAAAFRAQVAAAGGGA